MTAIQQELNAMTCHLDTCVYV